jgi:hypothetical protein
MKKLYFTALICIYSVMSFAKGIDNTGITAIDDNVTIGQNILTLTAKWGGIGLLVGAGVMLGMGKLKGEALGFLFYLILGLGLICAGFSWWNTSFTAGFTL